MADAFCCKVGIKFAAVVAQVHSFASEISDSA